MNLEQTRQTTLAYLHTAYEWVLQTNVSVGWLILAVLLMLLFRFSAKRWRRKAEKYRNRYTELSRQRPVPTKTTAAAKAPVDDKRNRELSTELSQQIDTNHSLQLQLTRIKAAINTYAEVTDDENADILREQCS